VDVAARPAAADLVGVGAERLLEPDVGHRGRVRVGERAPQVADRGGQTPPRGRDRGRLVPVRLGELLLDQRDPLQRLVVELLGDPRALGRLGRQRGPQELLALPPQLDQLVGAAARRRDRPQQRRARRDPPEPRDEDEVEQADADADHEHGGSERLAGVTRLRADRTPAPRSSAPGTAGASSASPAARPRRRPAAPSGGA